MLLAGLGPAARESAVLIQGATPWIPPSMAGVCCRANPRRRLGSAAQCGFGARRGSSWQVPTPARGCSAAGTDEGERPRTVTTPASTTSGFGFASHLFCRECGATSALGASHACAECFGPLEVGYELPRLTRAGQLARELGLRALWLKDERGNPTHSFKDRVVAVALAAAVEMGYKVLACPSTGNLANAVAAAAARAGIRSVVLIPADLEPQKIVATAVYGGTMVPIDGTYDDVNRLASELADDRADWAFVNVNVRPYYAEGSKTIGYEIAEQLGWRLPEQIVVPVASGAQLVKIDKSFRELIELGLVADAGCRVFGAQAAGCAPVAAAFLAGQDVVQPVRPDTIAKSLAIGNPADGPYVLDVVRRTGGVVADVSDAEVVDSMRLLARAQGVFGETAGGVTVGVLRKLLAAGQLDPDAETVIINSGDGLQTLDAVAPSVTVPTAIKPTIEAFQAQY